VKRSKGQLVVEIDTIEDLRETIDEADFLLSREPKVYCKGTFKDDRGELVFYTTRSGTVLGMDEYGEWALVEIDGLQTKVRPDVTGQPCPSSGYFQIVLGDNDD